MKNKDKENPGMFDSKASFANITLEVDTIDRKRTEESDNVMAMFYEEQPYMWEFVKDDITKTIGEAQETIDFLDVGTGSGVWSILVTKNTGAKKVLAIDKSRRAIDWAKKNALINHVNFDLRNEFYNISTAPYRSCKVIGIYAPYHLYPSELELAIPQHARGGIDGQQVFKEQLTTANYHLAENGIIVFNQMCVGRNGKPAFTEYIPRILEGCSLEYTNILAPMKTKTFLEKIYDNRFSEYVKNLSDEFPELYYCDGIIRRDGKGLVKEVKSNIPLKGRTWNDRIKLHQEIAKHGLEGGLK